jgi:hypothetical protein
MRYGPATPIVKTHTPKLMPVLTGLVLVAATAVSAQTFSRADSGWVRLFNGANFDGFYSRTYNVGGVNAPKVVPPGSPYTIEYPGTDTAAIRVGTTANQGNIGTLDTTFSHYRLSWESKYDAINANSNSGLTYHVDESAIRMNNNWPRSIEFQGKQSEIGSAFSIQQVTFDTRASSTGQGANYVATGGSAIRACEFGCNGRWYKGNPLITPYASATPTVPRWLRFHLVARGADSAIHIVNDTTVMRLWNIRIFNDSTKPTGSTTSNSSAPSNNTPARPWDRGGLGWQAEGATVRYRRLEIMRIPPTTPMNEHFLHRLFLDSPVTKVYNLTEPVRWRSIGTIPWVRIEQRSQGGQWTVIADSLPNTGSHAFPQSANCASPACELDFRISGPDYVWGDSTVGRTTSIRAGNVRIQGALSFGLGTSTVLAGLSVGTQIEIRNVAGGLIRTMSIGENNLVWDRRDLRGAKVPTGLYFVRALNEGVPYRTGRVVVD